MVEGDGFFGGGVIVGVVDGDGVIFSGELEGDVVVEVMVGIGYEDDGDGVLCVGYGVFIVERKVEG